MSIGVYYKVGFTTLLMTLVLSVQGQSFEEFMAAEQKRYNDFFEKEKADYQAFRDRANAEFAVLLDQRWHEMEAAEAKPQPKKPEPPEPRSVDPSVAPKSIVVPVAEVVAPQPKKEPKEAPKPLVPIEVTPEAGGEQPNLSFTYYGTPCSMNVGELRGLLLDGCTERSVSKYWKKISDESYEALVSSSLAWREKLQLSDWGYVRFLSLMGDAVYRLGANESTVLQLFLLTQSGYQARIARAGDRLYLLLPFDTTLYEYPYVEIDKQTYYIIGKGAINQAYSVFTHQFPGEKRLSLSMASEPRLLDKRSEKRHLASKRYGGVAAQLSVNKNLVDFYNDYPRNGSWQLYTQASLSSAAKESLYPMLKRNIAGKSEHEAVNILLDFVQTAFNYKTDDEHFGYERPLFADETLFYEYSDCEDRSILFSVLVQELLSLPVVLVNYPDHLATAVRFSKSIEGSYLTVDNERYVICDPTYIGAAAGLCMPDYQGVGATIVKL